MLRKREEKKAKRTSKSNSGVISRLYLTLLLFVTFLIVFPNVASAYCTPCPNFTIFTKHSGVSCEEPRIVVDLYKGVPAFSNNDNSGGTSYQCVEYIRRFYDLRKGYSQGDVCEAAWSGDAISYDNPEKAERMGLQYFSNGGTEPPKPGDIVVFDINKPLGHVVIVKKVIKNENLELHGIVTVEQNYGSSSRILDAHEDNGKFYIDEDNARCWLRSKITCPEETNVYNTERDIPVMSFGELNDIPITGDWNGDGKATIGVYRPSTSIFSLDYDNDGIADEEVPFGIFGDIPIVGDWDNDGKDEIGIYRSADPDKNFADTSIFFLDHNNDGKIDENDEEPIKFGIFGDLPVVGDWDNDGYDEIGVFRSGDSGIDISTFFLDDNNDGITDREIEYGMLEDIPISGDWNGDGKDTIGVYRECNAVFYLNNLDNCPLAHFTTIILFLS